jgi:hypothetical protein
MTCAANTEYDLPTERVGKSKMAMNFEELDEVTRGYMLKEFEGEESTPGPYRGKVLSLTGLAAWNGLMSEAIRSGNEESLTVSLQNQAYWQPTETYIKNGVQRVRNVNSQQAAERLALTEFNTWYVRGLSKRFLDEGVAECQAYRGAIPKWEPGDCTSHEGQILQVQVIYSGHRKRYWPEPGDTTALSIPFGPGCHHTIRRFLPK